MLQKVRKTQVLVSVVFLKTKNWGKGGLGRAVYQIIKRPEIVLATLNVRRLIYYLCQTFVSFCKRNSLVTADGRENLKTLPFQLFFLSRQLRNRDYSRRGSREPSSISLVSARFKMAANGEFAGVKVPNLKSIFWKMIAIYKILHISLDFGRNLEQCN